MYNLHTDLEYGLLLSRIIHFIDSALSTSCNLKAFYVVISFVSSTLQLEDQKQSLISNEVIQVQQEHGSWAIRPGCNNHHSQPTTLAFPRGGCCLLAVTPAPLQKTTYFRAHEVLNCEGARSSLYSKRVCPDGQIEEPDSSLLSLL
ncbi:uncharacterized protein AAES06_006151 [Glossophaga mutica]